MKTSLKEMILYGVWLCMYILCVGFGTVEEVEGFGKFLFIAVSVIFFLPGAWILYMGVQEKNKKMLLRVRILAICSLTLTVIVFSANVIAVASSAEVGNTLNDLLNLVSAPMFCSQYWILSLFLWSCLLSASFTKIKEQ